MEMYTENCSKMLKLLKEATIVIYCRINILWTADTLKTMHFRRLSLYGSLNLFIIYIDTSFSLSFCGKCVAENFSIFERFKIKRPPK